MQTTFPLARALLTLTVFLAATASANPTGPQVVSGKAVIQPVGPVLNTPNTIVNWQTFSISANEITRFINPSASSAVLNRLTGQNSLPILGSLHSNGSVLPIGPVVVNGQVTISQSGNLLQITNSPNSIINWQSFSIGANEITRFLQQSASSAVLNRVVGAGGTIDPSVILGVLQSNGRVFLINPSGIVFGAGSQVDVAGLVVSSLDLSNADFLAGRLRFTEVPGAGSVVNQGAINAASGGQVYLIGSSVANSGIITTPQGEVILAAGKSVELVNPGTPNLRVEINAPDNEALNLGQIVASSGRIGIYAGLIRSSGTLNADRAVGGPDGEILLKATKSITLEGTISAGGTIIMDAGSDISITTPGEVAVCPATSSLTCGGSNPPPSVVIVGNSESGSVTVNGAVVPLTPPGVNPGPVTFPFELAAQALRRGTGQIVESLLSTIQISDIARAMDGTASGSLTAPRENPTFE